MDSPQANMQYCWVCGVRFNDLTTNPGPANREEHHIIPRAYGGSDGPVVSLCDSHHTALHKMAVALASGKPYFQHLNGHSRDQQNKLLFLATRVRDAEAATRNDPNKKASVVLSLDAATASKLDALKKVYPQARSRAGVIKVAIDVLYNRTFLK